MRYIAIILISMLSHGCKYTPLTDDVPTKGSSCVELSFNINKTIDNQSDYTIIKLIRVIAVNKLDDQIVLNQASFNQQLIQNDHGSFVINIFRGEYNFVVIANENAEIESKLKSAKTGNDISKIWVEISSNNEANIVLVHNIKNVTIDSKENNQAKVSLDNGKTWINNIPVALERLAAKVSLSIKKADTTINDEIGIVGVRICHIPTKSSIEKNIYNQSDYFDKEVPLANFIPLPNDNNKHTTIFNNELISENIPLYDNNISLSTFVKIIALYNGSTVTYTTPLGSWDSSKSIYTNYNVNRNTHYKISATISTEGVYVNDIIISVAPWTNSNSEVDFDNNRPQYYGEWSEETKINGNEITITEQKAIEYKFSLTSPKLSRWRAQIDNPIDFEFDKSSINQGVADGNLNSIRIKCRPNANPNAICHFYITVDNQEIDLDYDGKVGTNNRYRIIAK